MTVAGMAIFLLCALSLTAKQRTASPTISLALPSPSPKENQPEDKAVHLIIDAGHGGMDGGTVSRGLLEKDLTIDVARKLQKILQATGETVHMTREGDTNPSKLDRIELANRFRRAILISIHFNYGEPPTAHGIETYYTDPKSIVATNWLRRQLKAADDSILVDKRGEKLASTIQRHAVEATGTRDRGIKNGSFAVIRDAYGPAVLIEGGFLSNGPEAVDLQDEDYRQRLAGGIGRGIKAYLAEIKGDTEAGASIEAPKPPAPVAPTPAP